VASRRSQSVTRNKFTTTWRPSLPFVSQATEFKHTASNTGGLSNSSSELLLDHTVLHFVPIRREQLRTQERAGIEYIMFLRLLNVSQVFRTKRM
jgi:hypothetical protein